jgi:hypothetical protein
MPTVETVQSVYPTLEDLAESGEIPPHHAREIGKKASFAVSFGSTQHDDLSDELKDLVWRVDDASYEEASQGGGLVYYHRGVGKVAFSACFWESAADAARAMHGTVHQTEAVPLAQSGQVYSDWRITFHSISEDAVIGFQAKPVDMPGHQLHS